MGIYLMGGIALFLVILVVLYYSQQKAGQQSLASEEQVDVDRDDAFGFVEELEQAEERREERDG